MVRIVLIFLLIIGGVAQTAWATPQEEIAQLIEQYRIALEKEDVHALKDIYAGEASFMPELHKAMIEGQLRLFSALGISEQSIPKQRLLFEDPTTDVDGDTALTRGYLRKETLRGDEIISTSWKPVGFVLKKFPNGWRIVNHIRPQPRK